MSTPITQLQNAQPPPTAEVPQDPEVLNVLNEMEQEVAAATRTQAQHVPNPPPPQQIHRMPPQIGSHMPVPTPHQPPVPVKPKNGPNNLYQPELLQGLRQKSHS